MSMDIDVYEFKETLKEFEGDNKDSFLKFSDKKGVAVIEVGKTSKAIDKKLMNMGYKVGERVIVVVQ